MNNQFAGPSAWGDYLTALEQVTPVIEAIAVAGAEAQVTRHTRLSEAAQKVLNTIQSFGNQRRTFAALDR